MEGDIKTKIKLCLRVISTVWVVKGNWERNGVNIILSIDQVWHNVQELGCVGTLFDIRYFQMDGIYFILFVAAAEACTSGIRPSDLLCIHTYTFNSAHPCALALGMWSYDTPPHPITFFFYSVCDSTIVIFYRSSSSFLLFYGALVNFLCTVTQLTISSL